MYFTLEELTKDKPKDSVFILDSGAYSAFKQNLQINIYDYIEFIKQYHEFFTQIVVLDVIGNPVNSEVNHLIMLKELADYDLTLIPVYHSLESFALLDYMIERDYKYIGLGMNRDYEKIGSDWLEEIFLNYDFESLEIKTHGFACTSNKYPLTTADSTSFIKFSIYGRILVRDGLPYIFEIEDDVEDDFIKPICDKLGITVKQMKVDESGGREARIRFNIEALDRVFQLKGGKKAQSGKLDLFAGSDFTFVPFNVKTLNEKYEYALSLGKEYTGYL